MIATFAGLGLLIAPAGANASMGPALQVFDPRAWSAYVVAMVLMEAWLIGRWLEHGWFASLWRAILFNAVTALFCTDLGGVAMKFVIVGSEADPNPLANAVALLVGFGLMSACFEGLFWTVRRPDLTVTEGRVVRRAVGVHMLGAVVGLAILLVPERPYPSLEGRTSFARRTSLASALRPCLALDRLPRVKSLEKALTTCGDPAFRDAWTAQYQPQFGRFATGEDREHPIGEWNASVGGKTWEEIRQPTWLFRIRRPNGDAFGCVYDDGGLKLTGNKEVLGL
ncbi:MAG: hypothetical protein ACO1SV_04625 [Fimbriimonas sp.]